MLSLDLRDCQESGLSSFAGVLIADCQAVSRGWTVRSCAQSLSDLESSTPLSRLVNGGTPSVSASPKKNESVGSGTLIGAGLLCSQ